MKIKSNLTKLAVISILTIFITLLSLTNNVYATNEQDITIYTSADSSTVSEDEGNLSYASGVTNEMCNSTYWAEKQEDADKVLMTLKEVQELNQATIDGAGTKVFDLVTMQEKRTAKERAALLASAEPIPTRALYIDGEKIDNTAYFTNLKNAMLETGFDTDEKIQLYAVAVERADIKAWPTDDIIGYYEDDPDDEMESSILNVNEPFIIGAKCVVNGETFYWGQSNICPGWVNAKSLAICADKEEWLDAWQVDIESKDFLVVVQDKIVLEPSILEPSISEVKLVIGTTLKLVPKDEIPEEIAERGPWNNYVVYLPTRDENGNYKRQYALISQHYSVSIGFLPLTQENILKVAFSCLGNRYGWGGMLGAMDCTLYTRGVYECFGIELPRNTSWQPKVPGKVTDISKLSTEEKQKYIENLPAGAILFFSGHAMLYVGTENNTNYVISSTGSLSDSVGELSVKKMYSIILNPLTVRRAAGTTWLENVEKVLNFEVMEYEFVEGAKQSIKQNESIQFTTDAYSKLFKELYIDDVLVDTANYTIEGSETSIKLSQEFSSALTLGKHTIKAVYMDKGEACTEFTITEVEEPTEPENPTQPEEPTEPENPTQPEEPTEPENPIQPEEPTKPENSTQPEEPTEPENPTQPEEPTKPENSTQPEEPIKKEYVYLEGEKQKVEQGKNIRFRIDAEYELFDKLYINEELVESKDYSVTSGSTIITLNEEYTKTLTVGQYNIKAVFKDGNEANTVFDIVEAEVTPSEPEEEKKEEVSDVVIENNANPDKELQNPPTGDNITVAVTLCITTLLGLVIISKLK